MLFRSSLSVCVSLSPSSALSSDVIHCSSVTLYLYVEPTDYCVSFVYKSRKPFHPERLLKVLGSNVAQLQVTRAKGLAWLITRNNRWGIWSQPSLHASLAVDITGMIASVVTGVV